MFSNFSNVPVPLTSPGSWLDPLGNTQVLDDPAKSGTPPAAGGGGDAPAIGASGSGGGAFGFSALLLLAVFGFRRGVRV